LKSPASGQPAQYGEIDCTTPKNVHPQLVLVVKLVPVDSSEYQL